jgi:hypothetical protein
MSHGNAFIGPWQGAGQEHSERGLFARLLDCGRMVACSASASPMAWRGGGRGRGRPFLRFAPALFDLSSRPGHSRLPALRGIENIPSQRIWTLDHPPMLMLTTWDGQGRAGKGTSGALLTQGIGAIIKGLRSAPPAHAGTSFTFDHKRCIYLFKDGPRSVALLCNEWKIPSCGPPLSRDQVSLPYLHEFRLGTKKPSPRKAVSCITVDPQKPLVWKFCKSSQTRGQE